MSDILTMRDIAEARELADKATSKWLIGSVQACEDSPRFYYLDSADNGAIASLDDIELAVAQRNILPKCLDTVEKMCKQLSAFVIFAETAAKSVVDDEYERLVVEPARALLAEMEATDEAN
jgi:hypothetical protein